MDQRLTLLLGLLLAMPVQAGLALRTRLWEPGSTIRIAVPGAPEADLTCLIAVVAELEAVVPLRFRFTPATRHNPLRPPHAVIRLERLSGQREEAGSSHVGNQWGRREYMLLRFVVPTADPAADCHANRQVILHEFGHLLGLLHEHQHPDAPAAVRDEVLRLNREGVREEQVAANFGPLQMRPDQYLATAYDPASIMHYAFQLGDPVARALVEQGGHEAHFRARPTPSYFYSAAYEFSLPGEALWRMAFPWSFFKTDQLSPGDVEMLQGLYGRP